MLEHAEPTSPSRKSRLYDLIPEDLDWTNVPRKNLSGFGLMVGWLFCPLVAWSVILLMLHITR